MASLGCLAARAAALLLMGVVNASAQSQDASFARLEARRFEMARGFAAQAARCAARQDTSHPVFHGCVDWHSAVHAAWALTAYARLTGDRRYEPFLERQLKPALLARELADLRAAPDFEMPYGRAWLLRLAVERKRAGGDGRLDALARTAAESLRAHYEAYPPDPSPGSYESASWALLNLLLYARANRDTQLQRFVVEMVRGHFLQGRCEIAAERGDFLGPCVLWAWLVSETLPAGEFRAWYARWNPGLESMAPVTAFDAAHDYGRNFSRAWGLYYLAARLDDPRLAGVYVAHVAAGYAPSGRWRGAYAVNGHWVAQFGMLAIAPLFAQPPAR